jgi:hypothetical protein
MVRRVVVGERTTAGDIASVTARTLNRASAVGPVRKPLVAEAWQIAAAIASTNSSSKALAGVWGCVESADSVGVGSLRLARTPGRAPFAAGLRLLCAMVLRSPTC